MPRVRSYLFYLGFRTAGVLIAWLPVRATWPLMEYLARRASRKSSQQSNLVRRHMERIVQWRDGGAIGAGEVDRLVEESFVSYALYWHELFRIRRTSLDDVRRRVSSKNHEVLDEALQRGKGFIIALPHVGNWELAGGWMSVAGSPITVVAEELRPRALFDWFCQTRNRLNVRVIGLNSDATSNLVHALAQNTPIGLLCDRDISDSGIEVNFFGSPARLPGGPAVLALRTGAPIIPTVTYLRADRTVHMKFGEPIYVEKNGSVRECVQQAVELLAQRIEPFIAAHPEQWHVFQPLWIDEKATGNPRSTE